MILYCSDDRVCFYSIGAGGGSPTVTEQSATLDGLGISEAPRARTHKQPLGHTALRNPTFHLLAPSDRHRRHRSLHVSFDVPEEEEEGEGKKTTQIIKAEDKT